MLGNLGSLSLLLTEAGNVRYDSAAFHPVYYCLLLSATVYYCLLLHQGQMTSKDTLTSTIYDTLLPH